MRRGPDGAFNLLTPQHKSIQRTMPGATRAERQAFARALADAGLELVVGIYSSWQVRGRVGCVGGLHPCILQPFLGPQNNQPTNDQRITRAPPRGTTTSPSLST